MPIQKQPDILLVVLDTLRADRLSCYGYSRLTTPNIDAFARQGTLFERAISPAQWTIPAHASIFTGEYPTTHMTTQIYDRHSKEQATLAETLEQAGYHTVGFCDNPLLGVVENELDRGFDEFYNYGGTVPERPPIIDSRPRAHQQIAQFFGRLVRRIANPIQDAVARNRILLGIALHPWIRPLWHKLINFKGNTAQSLRDLVGYLRTRQQREIGQPLFAFANLMETHLPYEPRRRFVRRFAPYMRRDRLARDTMRSYNMEHYRWMIPFKEPLPERLARVLHDMYDAEIAYEDHLLRHLFTYLNQPQVRDNTLVIITSDHGEGQNHHHFVGHSLVAYDDLVHVPLIVRYPQAFPANTRVSIPVSTRRIFHTALDAAGIDRIQPQNDSGVPVDIAGLSLARALDAAQDPENGIVFAEAPVPDTLIALMEASNNSELIDEFRCRLGRQAVYRDRCKLIAIDGQPDELFDLDHDRGELENLIEQQPDLVAELDQLLREFCAQAELRRPANWKAARLRLEEDKKLVERLRGLGYLG